DHDTFNDGFLDDLLNDFDDLLDDPEFRLKGRTKPIIITTAHTGARYSPWEKDVNGNSKTMGTNFYAKNIPITPDEVVDDAVAAYHAGSRLIHLHARNPKTGVQYADINWYKEVADRI